MTKQVWTRGLTHYPLNTDHRKDAASKHDGPLPRSTGQQRASSSSWRSVSTPRLFFTPRPHRARRAGRRGQATETSSSSSSSSSSTPTTSSSMAGNDILVGVLGWTATACFALILAPQIVLNQLRKSCEGFSISLLLLWHIGAAAVFPFFMFEEEPLPLMLQVRALRACARVRGWGFDRLAGLLCRRGVAAVWIGSACTDRLTFSPQPKPKPKQGGLFTIASVICEVQFYAFRPGQDRPPAAWKLWALGLGSFGLSAGMYLCMFLCLCAYT